MPSSLLIAPPARCPDPSVPAGVALRPLEETDLGAVGAAYRRTYIGSADEMTPAEAAEEVLASWRGAYGRWLGPGSIGAWRGDELVGAILTVTDAPWEDVPRGPFIIDLFVVPEARRRGIGRALVRTVQAAVPTALALRVDDSTTAARALYESLGFRADDGV